MQIIRFSPSFPSSAHYGNTANYYAQISRNYVISLKENSSIVIVVII